jgi:isoquinoline 1-oxidoreductase beta subunit
MMRKLTRRKFLVRTAWAGSGLFLALPLAATASRPPNRQGTTLSVYVNIGNDGMVHLFYPFAEMGQGVRTLAATVAAEELGVLLDRVRVHTPSPGPGFDDMQTGGSYTARATFGELRRHYAGIRRMLEQAAAERWLVPVAALRTSGGQVIHDDSGRALAYEELAHAAAQLPVPGDAPLKPRNRFRLLGRPQRHVHLTDMVTGRAVYGIDQRVEGMVHAALLRAPVVGARLRSFDDRPCRNVDGYLGHVVVRGNAVSSYPEHLRDGVAVLASNTWAAQQAAQRLLVNWEPGENAGFDTPSYMRRLEAAASSPTHTVREEGDVTEVLAQSDRVLEATYRGPFLAHAPMEPMNAIAIVSETQCEVFAPSHAQSRLVAGIRQLTGLPAEAITVHTPLIGGSFGRRLQVDYALEAVLIARAAGRPVKLTWSREEDMLFGCLRSPYVQKMQGAVRGGSVTAFHQQVACSSVWQLREPQMLVDGLDDTVAMPAAVLPYAIPNLRISQHTMALPYPIGWWRASYPTIQHTVQECWMDELIHAADRDPFDARLSLLAGGDTIELAWHNGWGTDKVDRSRLIRVLQELRELSRWDSPKKPGQGRGLAMSVYSDTHLAQVVELTVRDGEIRLDRVTCVVDCGFAINPDTVAAQMEGGIIFGLSAALFGQITFEKGQVMQSSFADYRILTFRDTPEIHVHIVDSQAEVSGVGEPGTHPVMAATCNAVFDATGVRIRSLPIADQLKKPPRT